MTCPACGADPAGCTCGRTGAEALELPGTAPGARLCGWCDGPIPAGARRDALYCGQRCRQAAHRLHRNNLRRVAGQQPRRFAYADPPYPGMAARYYAGHRDYAGEVDHRGLLEQLATFDGWALSTSERSLQPMLALAGELDLEVRVAAWVRGERPVRAWGSLSAWEPVLYAGAREIERGPAAPRRTDALVHHARARRADPRHLTGAKPAAFVWWLFDLLGAQPGTDTLVDLFPGSGGVGRAWAHASAAARADA